MHNVLSRWTREFWIGGTPSARVNIDNNLAYLESTRYLPNFDTSIVIPQASIASEYLLWSGRPNDIYDGDCDGNRGVWSCGMGVAGAHNYIAPYPQWAALWLYTGDWRMRQMSLGMADLAGAYPGNLRESDPTKRLSRADPVGLNPSTGLGHVVSTADRKTLLLDGSFMFTYGLPADNLKRVGTILWPPNDKPAWSWDTDHTPSPFYPAYILTGDPWYLDEMYAWAAFAAALPITRRIRCTVAVRLVTMAPSRAMSVDRRGPRAIAPRLPLPPRTPPRKKPSSPILPMTCWLVGKAALGSPARRMTARQ